MGNHDLAALLNKSSIYQIAESKRFVIDIEFAQCIPSQYRNRLELLMPDKKLRTKISLDFHLKRCCMQILEGLSYQPDRSGHIGIVDMRGEYNAPDARIKIF